MWRLSFLFLAGSVGLTVWLADDLGLLGDTPGFAAAAETAVKKEAKQSAGLESLEKSMLEREKAVTEREAELTRRERELKDKESVLAAQTARYEKIIADLQKKVAGLDALNDEKIEAYRKLYEKMEPKKTASLLEELDPFMAGQILGQMNQSKAAEIMTRMSNAKVKLITEKYLVKRYTASSSKKDSGQ